MPRRVAIVGTASSGAGAPFADTSFEIWGVSKRAPYVTRANRWFELHRLDGEPADWAAGWRKELKADSQDIGELLMFWPEHRLAPRVAPYPYKRIAERFGTYFMTSTFAWMMALAIDEMRPLTEDGLAHPVKDGDEIAIYGVDMEFGTEYQHQRTGFRHFFYLAQELGIIVTRDVSGGLVHEPVPYPFWQDDPLICKLDKRNSDVRNGLARINRSLEHTRSLIAQNRAILEELTSLESHSVDLAQRRAAIEKELSALMETSGQLSAQLVAHAAVDSEQQWFKDYLKPS